MTALPKPFRFQARLMHRHDFTGQDNPTSNTPYRASVAGLAPGLYTARFSFSGVPLGGYELDFVLAEAGEVMLLAKYRGPYALPLRHVEVYRLAGN